jgi:hypothetical protein
LAIADLPRSPIRHLLICGGKGGQLYVVNATVWAGTTAAISSPCTTGGDILDSAFWNNHLYIASKYASMKAFTLDRRRQYWAQTTSSHCMD